VEQLFQYAKMMRLPIEDVIDIEDFKRAIRSLSFCDTILVDTIGSSQYDKDKLEKIKNFEYLGIDTIIFTKFDETKSFGNIFSFTKEIGKPLSYFSVGQEVPDDIFCASSEYLIQCMLDGFTKEKNAKPGN